MDDTDDLPPGHNAGPGDKGGTATDLHNLRRNSGVHDKNTNENEEDWRSTAREGEESATPSENENENEN